MNINTNTGRTSFTKFEERTTKNFKQLLKGVGLASEAKGTEYIDALPPSAYVVDIIKRIDKLFASLNTHEPASS